MEINDYVVMSISDKRKRLFSAIDSNLIDLNKHYIKSVDASKFENINNFFLDNPEIKETRCYKTGFIGHMMSEINILKYCIKNNINNMLILEDDAVLSKNFITDLSLLMNHLPSDYDYFMLFEDTQRPKCYQLSKIESRSFDPVYVDEERKNRDEVHNDWIIENNEFIVRVYQKLGSVGLVISLNGCKKILSLIEKHGFGTSRRNGTGFDEMIYYFAKFNQLNGYQPNPKLNMDKLVTIEPSLLGTDTESTIRHSSYVCLSDILNIYV
jgi:GR25 family glycosyltransferase involved in LPS biosynthesis